MPLALPLGLLFSLLFGVMIWMLPAPLVVAAAIGIVAVATIMRRPVRGLLLFCLIGTFLPYSTVQIGIRTTVSEALIMLTWASYLLHGVFQERQRLPSMLRPERLLVALMLFSAFPFLVGQLTVVAEGNGPINWIRWLFNLSILFLVPRLLTDLKMLEDAIIALLGGTLLLLVLSIAVYVTKGSATAIIPILGSLGYSGADILSQSLLSLASRMGSPWMHPNVAGGAGDAAAAGLLLRHDAQRRGSQAGPDGGRTGRGRPVADRLTRCTVEPDRDDAADGTATHSALGAVADGRIGGWHSCADVLPASARPPDGAVQR